jgi:uncharacterized protein (DUF2062 family)
MLFKRRTRLGLWSRFRLWLWPRVSWRRSVLYYAKRILRLSGTPYAIAMGAAVGAFASFTPFVGLHLILTLVLAWLLGGNMIAGAIGTAIGNPLTFPLIWASTFEIGQIILRGGSDGAPARLGHELTNKSFEQIVPLLKPMVVGGVPLGLIAGTLMYLAVYKGVSAYQQARRKRMGMRRMVESRQEP